MQIPVGDISIFVLSRDRQRYGDTPFRVRLIRAWVLVGAVRNVPCDWAPFGPPGTRHSSRSFNASPWLHKVSAVQDVSEWGKLQKQHQRAASTIVPAAVAATRRAVYVGGQWMVVCGRGGASARAHRRPVACGMWAERVACGQSGQGSVQPRARLLPLH